MKKQLIGIAKSETNTEKEKLNEIANQLSCPEGEQGIVMGELLNETNKGMIEESIKALKINAKNRVLELGHGSCYHLKTILNEAEDVKYFGMEISQVMRDEAEKINNVSVKNRKALFQLYDGNTVSYVSNFFDRILLVNTIYFLKEPILFFNEMYRLLKPGGSFIVSFANKKFMKTLPFVTSNDVFNLYDEKGIKSLASKTGFIFIDIVQNKEKVKSKTGALVNREYSIVTMSKKRKENKLDTFYK